MSSKALFTVFGALLVFVSIVGTLSLYFIPPNDEVIVRKPTPHAALRLAQTPRFEVQLKNETTYILPMNGSHFTLSDILELCHNGFNNQDGLTITPTYAIADGHAIEQDYLSTCNSIEIATSQGARSMGHCSDFAQYIFHGNARLTTDQLSRETFDIKIRKCATESRFLHGEYPIAQLLESNATNWWMPNIEQVHTEQLDQLSRYSLVLCKTRITCTAFDKYLAAKNMTSPTTLFMSHSTPDTHLDAVEVLGPDRAAHVNQDFNKFIHVYGGSGRKSTRDVLDCWARHPFWPTLTIVGNHSPSVLMKGWWLPAPRNIEFHESADIQTLRELQLSNGVHICPSSQEGYGHYINEARAVGALVVTTDWAPMNEFVQDGESGILVNHYEPVAEEYQALAEYFVSPVGVSSWHVCAAIERVLQIDENERRAMGRLARLRYEDDDARMQRNIQSLIK
ncbi:hypothetical protein HDU98_011936 [Podochytrium sp. JEL0797]|nr:hypothetical protein HDU98_011936 [Podochytrium sp. JEL0797]